MGLSPLDLVIVAGYVVGIVALAIRISRRQEGRERDTREYFLAGKALPWWAIGASLIAANISAEQIIGMSGSGFAIGLGIASYEWMSALTLIIVGKYFLPIFLKRDINTMPQFLEQRYDKRVRTVLAVFWLGVYVFVNLTSILWLGALAIATVTGLNLVWGLVLLGALAMAYSLYGGLKAIAFTDVIQVALLVMGGLFISYTALDLIGDGKGAITGFAILTQAVPEKFDLILSRDNPNYVNLPGLSVLLGGMWIMNFSYWGFNQYIIQRALAARDVRAAQNGIVFAAYLKLLMPVIVVLPGIAAALLVPDLTAPDRAYPEMMKLVPSGFRGLVFAALIAAIVSSLGSMTNSVSTIFTLDIYRHIRTGAAEHHLVVVGRCTSLAAIVLAMICAQPLLGNLDQAFQYIQEFTGFFTPGIVSIFFLGMFWRRTNVNGALVAAIGSAVLSLAFKLTWPELPFLDRVGFVFLLCMGLGVVVSELQGNGDRPGAIDLKGIDFGTSATFNFAGIGVALILIALYATWW